IFSLCAAAQAQAQSQSKSKSKSNRKSLSVVVVGDVGLNRNGFKVHPDGLLEGPGTLPWSELMGGVATLIDGDLNFMNLETVVTDRNDIAPGNKGQSAPYLFRSHPSGVKKLLD